MQGEGMAGGASFPIGGDDHDLVFIAQCVVQGFQAGGMDAVVVAEKDLHPGPRKAEPRKTAEAVTCRIRRELLVHIALST
jgi:hypothetical protein